MFNKKAIALSLTSFGLIVFAAIMGTPGFAQNGPKPLFIQQDKVVTFDLTPPVTGQPLGGGVGAQVGTATGAINGTSVVNFKFTFTSNPFARPLTFDFDNRVGITDVDGDQIIFKSLGTGRFNVNLSDPTVGGDPGSSPFQVFGGTAAGGPLVGTYEVVATSGKYVSAYPIGQTFPFRSVSFNPATPPTPPGTTGSSYVEVFSKSK